jgi:putative alpha-1,2-mannosidase
MLVRLCYSDMFTGGSDADNVIVDAYVKNLTGIDWELAYSAILNDAENEPLEWSVEGRGGLTSWKTLNYIPYLDFDPVGFGTNSRSISRTLEYRSVSQRANFIAFLTDATQLQ